MGNNKVKAIKTEEVEITSDVWRSVIQQACMRFAHEVLYEELDRLVREMGYSSWGSQGGYIRVLGNRMAIDKPRARKAGKEVSLPAYKKLQGKQQWTQNLVNMVLGGLGQRQFEGVANIIGTQYGLSKSQVSRHVVNGLKHDYETLMATRCDDVIGLMLDGIHFGKKPNEICVIAALGITTSGEKKLLGIWSGGTENSTVVGSLLDDLIDRGLKEPKLSVIDGSKALRAAITNKWDTALIARCQEHKKRNILKHCTQSQQDWAKREYQKICHADTYEEGYRFAEAFHRDLKKVNLSAANSFREGMEGILVPLLIEDKQLRKFFSTTNAIESLFSMIRGKTGRVKRWRTANSVMYWMATGYRQQKKNLNRISGYRSILEINGLKERLSDAQKRLKVVSFKAEEKIAA